MAAGSGKPALNVGIWCSARSPSLFVGEKRSSHQLKGVLKPVTRAA
jgi:hypothetical protein